MSFQRFIKIEFWLNFSQKIAKIQINVHFWYVWRRTTVNVR